MGWVLELLSFYPWRNSCHIAYLGWDGIIPWSWVVSIPYALTQQAPTPPPQLNGITNEKGTQGEFAEFPQRRWNSCWASKDQQEITREREKKEKNIAGRWKTETQAMRSGRSKEFRINGVEHAWVQVEYQAATTTRTIIIVTTLCRAPALLSAVAGQVPRLPSFQLSWCKFHPPHWRSSSSSFDDLLKVKSSFNDLLEVCAK